MDWFNSRAQESCEGRGGRPGLPVPNNAFGLCGRKATLNLNWIVSELRSRVKVEVDVLGSPSLIALVMVSLLRHIVPNCPLNLASFQTYIHLYLLWCSCMESNIEPGFISNLHSPLPTVVQLYGKQH